MSTTASSLNLFNGYQILSYGLVIALLAYLYFKEIFSYWKDRKIQYVSPIPLFGNLLPVFLLRRNIAEQLGELYRNTTGSIVGIFMLNRPALLVRNPDVVKKLLIKNFDHFNNRSVGGGVDHARVPNGTCGLLASQDDTWKWLRKTVTPAFSASQLKSTTSDIQNVNEKAVDFIRRSSDKISGDINVRDVCSRYSIESGCSTFFGIDPKCFSSEESPYMVVNTNLFDYRLFMRGVNIAMSFISPAISKMLGLEFFHGESTRSFVDHVRKTMIAREDNMEYRNDYLDIIREAIESYEGEGNLLFNTVEIFVANNETLAAVLTFCCFELVKNQEIQKKLRAEILGIQKDDKSIPCEDLCQLKYLECFVKEVIRMYPNVPFLDRICKKDFLLDDPQLKIEEGTSVYVSLLGIHFDPEYYPEPHVFNPDRFSNDSIDWSVYLPFGKGPRMCPDHEHDIVIIVFPCSLNIVSLTSAVEEHTRTMRNMPTIPPPDRYLTKIPSMNILLFNLAAKDLMCGLDVRLDLSYIPRKLVPSHTSL